MASRGHGFLGWNNRFRGGDQFFLLDRALVDIGAGISWLRSHGVEVVVLLGNSGGGSLMAAYNAQIHDPVLAQPPFGPPLLAHVTSLPTGDLYVSVAAHLGRPYVLTAWMDPSVTDESDPLSSDPDLDMYCQGRRVPFAAEFVERYRMAQRQRNQRITNWAKAEMERLELAGVRDRLFLVPRTWADLRFVDHTIDPSERPVPACYQGDPRIANAGPPGLGSVCTIRTWLSMWSLETSECRGETHLGALTMPALVIQATADSGVFSSDADRIYASIASKDKERVDVAGDHYFRDRPGARDAVADVMASWLHGRCG